jgi:hypothetical protein
LASDCGCRYWCSCLALRRSNSPDSHQNSRAEGADASAIDHNDGAPSPAHFGLPPDAIRKVVMAHRGALQACYELYAKKDPTLEGTVTMAWTIDASGFVTSAAVVGSTIPNALVASCILRQVPKWLFPASNEASEVRYPFSFGIRR